MSSSIDKLIINSPYEEPTSHWFYDRDSRDFSIKEGRRPAGYVVATPRSQVFDDPGIFVAITLVNKIRPRVKKWKESGYPGVTGITKRLLDHWQDNSEREDRRLFFCQLEAIETLIWLVESPESDRVGIDIKGDGGGFERWCSKMATGSGKTRLVVETLADWINSGKQGKDPNKRFILWIVERRTPELCFSGVGLEATSSMAASKISSALRTGKSNRPLYSESSFTRASFKIINV